MNRMLELLLKNCILNTLIFIVNKKSISSKLFLYINTSTNHKFILIFKKFL
jgi:hypothetical protein